MLSSDGGAGEASVERYHETEEDSVDSVPQHDTLRISGFDTAETGTEMPFYHHHSKNVMYCILLDWSNRLILISWNASLRSNNDCAERCAPGYTKVD